MKRLIVILAVMVSLVIPATASANVIQTINVGPWGGYGCTSAHWSGNIGWLVGPATGPYVWYMYRYDGVLQYGGLVYSWGNQYFPNLPPATRFVCFSNYTGVTETFQVTWS